MKIQLKILRNLPIKSTDFQSFIKVEHISGLEIRENFEESDESNMGFLPSNVFELIISSAPITAAIMGILNCIKAYIEINKKDKVKISINNVEIEITSRNYKKIDKHLKHILRIAKKYDK